MILDILDIEFRVAQEIGVQVGSLVGYQIGMEHVGTKDTALTFMTTGILKQKLVHQRNLSGITHVIIDEGER